MGGELSSSSLISSLLFGCRLNAFKKMSRSHGFQRPLHPYQVLSWVIFFGTQALFFTVQLPHLPSQVRPISSLSAYVGHGHGSARCAGCCVHNRHDQNQPNRPAGPARLSGQLPASIQPLILLLMSELLPHFFQTLREMRPLRVRLRPSLQMAQQLHRHSQLPVLPPSPRYFVFLVISVFLLASMQSVASILALITWFTRHSAFIRNIETVSSLLNNPLLSSTEFLA